MKKKHKITIIILFIALLVLTGGRRYAATSLVSAIRANDNVKAKRIIEGEYYILNDLPFAHHLHGNSHLEESVKPLVFLHYHSYKKVVSQFL